MAEKKSNQSSPSQDAISLDDLLINIQKALSRVSQRTASVPESDAKSVIYGDVDFSIELKVEGEDDRLLVKKDGSVNLSMSGKISTDIRDDEVD